MLESGALALDMGSQIVPSLAGCILLYMGLQGRWFKSVLRASPGD